MTDVEVTIFVFGFYIALLVILYVFVRRKCHESRNALKELALVLGSIVLHLTAAALIVWAMVSVLSMVRSEIAIAFGSGAIMIALIRSIRSSFKRIGVPISGWEPTPKTQREIGTFIPEIEYISKYKVRKEKLDSAISKGLVKASIESGVLMVEDRKPKI